MIHDAETGKIIDVNETTLRMYGYCSKEELLAGNIGKLSANIQPYTEHEAQDLIKKCINEGPRSLIGSRKRKQEKRSGLKSLYEKQRLGARGRFWPL